MAVLESGNAWILVDLEFLNLVGRGFLPLNYQRWWEKRQVHMGVLLDLCLPCLPAVRASCLHIVGICLSWSYSYFSETPQLCFFKESRTGRLSMGSRGWARRLTKAVLCVHGKANKWIQETPRCVSRGGHGGKGLVERQKGGIKINYNGASLLDKGTTSSCSHRASDSLSCTVEKLKPGLYHVPHIHSFRPCLRKRRLSQGYFSMCLSATPTRCCWES